MQDVHWAFRTGAAVSTKAVWWDLCLGSLLMHLFLVDLLS